ncbi:MAG: protein arginine kinase [Clostridiales bacterium]|nr:protein arginine kinase [Clostridiales bacterium]
MSEKWYLGAGAQNDIVLSTRIRLARNLSEYPFPAKLGIPERIKVNNLIKDALSCEGAPKLKYIEMKTLSQYEAVSLAERHLISPEFASSGDGRALLLAPDEAVSIMLCEEDHIRLQVMYAGLALEEAFAYANTIDDIIDSKLHYAFDERIGYLTQCPTNLGTGMRASVMLHLPALTRCGQMQRLVSTVSKLGLAIRGSYGEGSAAKGDLYQLSNQITLGISEKSAIENLKSITLQIAAQERAAREELCKDINYEDKIFRAYGILSQARLLTSDEFMELISFVRLGAVKKLLPIDEHTVNDLLVSMQPATISLSVERPLDAQERDILRAQRVRDAIKEE